MLPLCTYLFVMRSLAGITDTLVHYHKQQLDRSVGSIVYTAVVLVGGKTKAWSCCIL